MKHITRKNNHYHINKDINGKIIYCGSYSTIDEARMVRDYLATYNWNLDLIDCLKEKDPSYIYRKRDYYQIIKRINGELVYFGFISILVLLYWRNNCFYGIIGIIELMRVIIYRTLYINNIFL